MGHGQTSLMLTVLLSIEQAYYLPETEYVHWARSHPVRTQPVLLCSPLLLQMQTIYTAFHCVTLQEYSKTQVVGLVNLVATMKGWKRKTRIETIERIEAGP
jgi:hypothetical protein